MSLASDFDQYADSGKKDESGNLASDFDQVAPISDASSLENFGSGLMYGARSTLNNALQGIYDIASRWNDRIAGSRLGNAAQAVTNFFGVKPAETLAAEKQAEIAANDKAAAPTLATTAGRIGNVAGQTGALLPLALVPGADTLIGAPLAGAVGGYLASPGTPDELLLAARNGAIGGGLGFALGAGINKGANMLEDARQGALANPDPNALLKSDNLALAKQYGYVLPPLEVNPGPVNSMLEGLSGKIKTSQAASQANQAVTNRLVAQELGIPEGMPITSDALDSIRRNAGQAYEAVRGVGPIPATDAFNATLDSLAQKYSGAEGSFPGFKNPDVQNLVDAFRVPQFNSSDAVDAISALRENAKSLYASVNAGLAKTSRGIADGLEQAIDDHLSSTGTNQNVLADFRNARTAIAKTYSVEKALNPVTGNVDASKLASQLQKGKPLSGTLKDVATIASAFPKATQALKQDVNQLSPLDWATGALGYFTQHPVAATAALARPLVRGAILSRPVQNLNYWGASSGFDPIGNTVLPALSGTPLRTMLQVGGMEEGLRNQPRNTP